MKEIIISKAFVKIPSECPECKLRFEFKLKKSLVVCNRCKYKWLVPIGSVEPLQTYSKIIEDILADDNEIKIKARANEENLINTLVKLREQKIKQKCWEVSEIEEINEIDKRIKCPDCGSCNNCVTCFNCGEHYALTKKNPRCPKCKSDKIKRTLIKKFEKKEGVNTCPFCKSEDVYWTYFYEDRLKDGKCPICDGTNLIKGKEIKVKQLIISRLPKYRNE